MPSEIATVPQLGQLLVNKNLAYLKQRGIFALPDEGRIADDLSEGQFVLQKINDDYRSSNVMGFLGKADERLVIQSRFANKEHDYFSQYLIERVLDIPNALNLPIDASTTDNSLNLLSFIFPHYLKQALRKGLFKTYVQHHYNDSNLKGTLDVAEHIRKNMPFTGKFAYKSDDFIQDNYLTELIRHTLEAIKQLSYGDRLLEQVRDEVQQIVQATPSYDRRARLDILNENERQRLRHGYYREYQILQRLCISLLRHQRQQVNIGEQKIAGFLFDGAWLWEEYVNGLLGDDFYHPQNKKHLGRQYLFSHAGKKSGEIYPDFISKNNANRVIIDAKYKWAKNISSKDYQQILAYMYRFNAQKGFYIYPETAVVDSIILNVNAGTSYEDNVVERTDATVTKLGLHIPQNRMTYSDFKAAMQISEAKLLAALNDL
ncbi:hypothetical protein WOSG25_010090 [Weissella oryzae SG25]|uniref:McrBC 5-methylcytosine restriction system component n=2 Tax=Weissella TaxID=46255 RepID=A0A069CRE9_WEIOS|nr:hypothetical protein WOSG25_010090 [Weissella oryzae SG25]